MPKSVGPSRRGPSTRGHQRSHSHCPEPSGSVSCHNLFEALGEKNRNFPNEGTGEVSDDAGMRTCASCARTPHLRHVNAVRQGPPEARPHGGSAARYGASFHRPLPRARLRCRSPRVILPGALRSGMQLAQLLGACAAQGWLTHGGVPRLASICNRQTSSQQVMTSTGRI